MVQQEVIKASIKSLLGSTASLDLEAAKESFAEQLSLVVYNAIISATVTIPPGACIVAGSSTTQTNPAPVIGSLS